MILFGIAGTERNTPCNISSTGGLDWLVCVFFILSLYIFILANNCFDIIVLYLHFSNVMNRLEKLLCWGGFLR